MNSTPTPEVPRAFAEARIQAITPLAEGYLSLRLIAPALAAATQPGHYWRCAWPERPDAVAAPVLRRLPGAEGVELLWSPEWPSPEGLTIKGLEGTPYPPPPADAPLLLLGEGLALASLFFLTAQWRAHHHILVLGGPDSQGRFPFTPRPSSLLMPEMPVGTIAAVPLLEDWGVASRLAHPGGHPGCYEGNVWQLAAAWRGALGEGEAARYTQYTANPDGRT